MRDPEAIIVMTEAEIACVVVTELQRQGFVTYEEVSTGYGAKRADIVATRGPVVAVVEVKAAMSTRLLDQLTTWLGGAHLIIGAVGSGRVGASMNRYLRHEGIGIWYVCGDRVSVDPAPRLHRTAGVHSLRRILRPEQRSGEYARAGTQGGYFTPFRRTCDALREVAKRQPGIELRAALKEAGHHYACDRSAMSSIPLLIRKGVIEGLRVEGKPLQVYVEPPC